AQLEPKERTERRSSQDHSVPRATTTTEGWRVDPSLAQQQAGSKPENRRRACRPKPADGHDPRARGGTMPDDRKARLPGPDSTGREAARLYLERGYAPVPVPFRHKGPRVPGWPELRLTADELDAAFPVPSNIALLTGRASGGLIDVDVDLREAIQLAPEMLPRTGMIHGRRGKPRSHWWYALTDEFDPATVKFVGADAGRGVPITIVEVRGAKAATNVPPSIHPHGESSVWDAAGDPEAIGWLPLRERVSRLAAASLLARYWQSGSRHELALALAGMLAHGGWSLEEIDRFVCAVARAADDEEWQSRRGDVRSTCERTRSGKATTGAPTLAERIGEPVVRQVREWLGL